MSWFWLCLNWCAMAARKLVVEVVAAKALMPKDGQGSTNAYCVVSSSFKSLGDYVALSMS